MTQTETLYDLIIIGAGPAGLSAALYAGRAKLKTLVIEKADIGGQIKITAEVVNYPGVFSTSGAALTAEMKKQAQHFGVQFITDDVTAVDFADDIKAVHTVVNETYRAVSVIIATGARPRKLGFSGEAEFAGRGIGYCATCDGEFFTGKDVFVIGAGFAAAEEAIFLTRFAKQVTVIAREPAFTCSKTIADKVLAHEKITVKFHTEILEVSGENVLNAAKFRDNQTGEIWDYKASEADKTFGVFVFVGYEPISEVFRDAVSLDGWGYIPADEEMQTNVPGVYAVGDIRPKRLRQLVTATADGAIAATAAEKYAEEKKHALGLEIALEEDPQASAPDFFTEDTTAQIKYVMERCQTKVSIRAVLSKDSKLSEDIRQFLRQFEAITDRVDVQIYEEGENPALEAQINTSLYPVIALFDHNGVERGAHFHAVPGGHELESFILAIYNIAGPGQGIDQGLLTRIKALQGPLHLEVGLSLSCTMCPDVVQACQRLAILNPAITASMIDLQHFPELREKHSIMSVPALITDDRDVLFGKKSLEEIVSYLEDRPSV